MTDGPDTDDADTEQRGDEHGRAGVSADNQGDRPKQVPQRDSLDWRGWLLVGVVVLSTLVIPVFVLYLPEAHWVIGQMGFSLRQAYLVFPMIPALLLGVVAIWSALRTRPPGERT